MRSQESLESELKSIFEDIETIKTTQPIQGDGWIVYRNRVDDSEWDYQNTFAAPGSKQAIVTFTPDGDVNESISVLEVGTYGAIEATPVSGERNKWIIPMFITAAFPFPYVVKIKATVISNQSGTVSMVVT